MRAMSFGSRGSIHDKAFNQKAVRTSSVRNRGSNFRDDESDDTSIDTSSFRNRGSNFRDQEDDDSKIDTSSFRNRGSSFRDEEDDDTSSFRNRGSSGSRNRGDLDDKLTAREKLKAKLKNKFRIDLSEEAPKKTRKILEPIICEHDNELHANPQNCRTYFKCSNGLPSLQSCPPNLIFDSSLGVCNWPEATECYEDPDAIISKSGSSDRNPPKPR